MSTRPIRHVAMRPRDLAAVAAVLIAGGSANCFGSHVNAIRTTICVLDAQPTKYDGKIVRVYARIEAGQWPELIDDIFDESCLRHALRLAGPDLLADPTEIKKLNNILLGVDDGVVGTRNKAVRAIIVGRFSAEQTMGVQAYTLYPISVSDIRVHYGEKSLIPEWHHHAN